MSYMKENTVFSQDNIWPSMFDATPEDQVPNRPMTNVVSMAEWKDRNNNLTEELHNNDITSVEKKEPEYIVSGNVFILTFKPSTGLAQKQRLFSHVRRLGADFKPAADLAVVSSSAVELPQGEAPPRWTSRATGRSVSPMQWIEQHYGQQVGKTWDPAGLTRQDLWVLDRPLYHALATQAHRMRKLKQPIPAGFDKLLESPRRGTGPGLTQP